MPLGYGGRCRSDDPVAETGGRVLEGISTHLLSIVGIRSYILRLFEDIGVYLRLSCFLGFQVVSFLRDLAYTSFLWFSYSHIPTYTIGNS